MKKIFCLILTFVLFMQQMLSFAEYTPTEKEITVTYNGEKIDFGEASALNVDGYTMVPVRSILEIAGCTVSYDNDKREVTAKKEGYELILAIGSTSASLTKNGEKKKVHLDIAPSIILGRTMLPVRFISESLGFVVNWNPSFKEVVIIDVDSWENTLRENSALSELIFADLKDKELYGGSAVVNILTENFTAKKMPYDLWGIIDNNFDVYLKCGAMCDFLSSLKDLPVKKTVNQKYIKFPVRHLLMLEMGIKLEDADSLWESFKNAVSDDKFIYSATAKNIDDMVNFLSDIKYSGKSKFFINKRVSLPQKSNVILFEEIYYSKNN